MAKLTDIGKFNKILEQKGQKLRAEKITGKEIILSNGLKLDTKRDVRLCKRRIMTGNAVWSENFDRLYSLLEEEQVQAEKECRSATSKQGGINCQNKHGEKIKKNLNTGVPWNKDLKGNYPYSYKLSEETKEKISKANSGKNNGMYGTSMSQEQREYKSELMKRKILSGEFTPNSNNRNTHWDSFYNGKKYRSSWEALYQYFDPEAEYETLRIPYCYNNNKHIYILDFVNHQTKVVVEVKPKELLQDSKTQVKIRTASQWCASNGYEFIIIDKEYLLSKGQPDELNNFDLKTQKKIRKLYEAS